MKQSVRMYPQLLRRASRRRPMRLLSQNHRHSFLVLFLLLCATTGFSPLGRPARCRLESQRRWVGRGFRACVQRQQRGALIDQGNDGRRRRTQMHSDNFSDEQRYATLTGVKVKDSSNLGLRLTTKAIDALFAFEPFFDFASQKARQMIIDRGDAIGVGWQGRVDGMKRSMDALHSEYDSLFDEEVAASTPGYYRAPFHCYKEGNLCWQAALEVEPSALSVHSNIYTPKGEFEAQGDDRLRSNYHQRMREMLRGPEPKDILDVGCSTGISTIKLARTFPSARRIFAADLSPHMLAVAKYNLRTRQDQNPARGVVKYIHKAGESTGLEERSVDLVSICLTSHELPAEATRDVFREAFRVLRPGGAISFMDMNPLAPGFQRLAANPLAFAGFKSTEPYLLEYISLDLGQELLRAGFRSPEVRSNSPRHRTCVAYVDK